MTNNRGMNGYQYLKWTDRVYGSNLSPAQRRRLSKHWCRHYVTPIKGK